MQVAQQSFRLGHSNVAADAGRVCGEIDGVTPTATRISRRQTDRDHHPPERWSNHSPSSRDQRTP